MPAASSKPTLQNAPKEGQDFPQQLMAMIEKKIRNLEKRKMKLQQYQNMVQAGQDLTKDQVQAASHFDEVCSNLDFAKELQKTFQTTINENAKQQKKQAKRESAFRHEQELQRIRDVILLNNVLNHLGTDHVRNDFLSGNNGAVKLMDDQVSHLDEFYKLVNPSREGEEEGEGKERSSASFETKLSEASEHLNSYIKEEEKVVLGTTYKDLKALVQEINQCGYLDNIPAPPEEEAVCEGEEEATPPATQGSGNAEETPEEDYIIVQQDQVPPPEAPEVISSLPPSVPTPQEEPPAAAMPRVQGGVDHETFPKPIEMPPAKLKTQGSDILAAVQQGSFNFMQDSMLDYDAPHIDPAVVATGQSYLPSQGYSALNHPPAVNAEQSIPQHQTLDQLSQAQAMDLPLSDPAHPSSLPTHPAYESQTTGLVSDPSYGMPSPYETQQHQQQQQQQQASLAQQQQQQQPPSLGHQGLGQQGLGQSPLGQPAAGLSGQRSHTGQQSGLGVQQTLDGMTQTQTMMSTQQQPPKRADLPEFPSPPVDAQLTKPEEKSSSLQASMLGQHTAGMGAGSSYSQSITSQTLSDPANQHTSQMVPPPSLTDHPTAAATLQHHDLSAAAAAASSSTLTPKSTMNASAPPFQMTSNSARSSPQMQAMQQSGALDQQQQQQAPSQTDMGTFQTADPAAVVPATPAEKIVERDSPKPETATTIPSQQREQEESAEQPSDSQPSDSTAQSSYTSYPSYQSNSYRGNGRGNPRALRGGGMNSTGFRGSRGGGMPYMGGRSTGRYPANPNPSPRGPGGYNSYIPRDNFQQRAPDLPFGNTSPNFSTFGRAQDPNFAYNRRVALPRGSPRGTRGGPAAVRGQANFRGRGGSSGYKPQVTV
ncbi:caprin-1-like isoform X2 [Acanthaster planci]|uniref:Caprin-1-like isoform X2 n=1 Tax=Acanthaster planci TaxID=133434 RepID=A0A8B7XRF0_ACAPL|nr:caprin-1-like isoform X2 [Acanthaster planci]